MKTPLLVLAALALPAALAAQQPQSISPRALAMGGGYTSSARGWEAVLTNPAMLSARGRPSLTIGLPNVRVETGSNTYSFSDFRDYANKHLTDADKQYLINRITADDSALTLRAVVGVAPLGLSIGSFGISAYTSGDMDMSMGPDAVELALYGNAHRSGPGEFFTARGAAMNGWAATTLAAGVAHGFDLTAGHLSVGVTYKKILGHAMGQAEETSSRFIVNPAFSANAAGHAVYTDQATDSTCSRSFSLGASSDPCALNAGTGYGVDIGGVLQGNGGRLTLSAVLVNALGSMTWDPGRLVYERTVDSLIENSTGGVHDTSVTTLLRGSQIDTDVVASAYRDALMARANFAQVLRVGAQYRMRLVTFVAGGAFRLKDGLDRQAAQRISAGAEARLLRIIPLRAGVATDLSGTLIVSAGTGLQLLGFNWDVSVASLSGSDRPGVRVATGFALIW